MKRGPISSAVRFRLKRQPHRPERGWVKILARRGGLARKTGGLARRGGWITLYQTDDHELAYDLLWYLINRPCSRMRQMPPTANGRTYRRHQRWDKKPEKPEKQEKKTKGLK